MSAPDDAAEDIARPEITAENGGRTELGVAVMNSKRLESIHRQPFAHIGHRAEEAAG